MPKIGIEFVFPVASLLCATLSAVYDVRSRRIPNFITLPAMVFGLILHAALGGWRQLATAAAGGLICGLIFFVFYLAGGMGAGDVKLITAAGCIAGATTPARNLCHSLYRRIEIQAAVMTIQFEKLKARLLANPKVKAEYDALAPEFEIAAELLRARLRAGLSQAELAARMGTSQSTIARLENGHTLPSTKTLLR